MVFCKRCHKRVIEMATTNTEFLNMCRCVNIVKVKKGFETKGNIRSYLSSERRSGVKRRIAKEMEN